MTLENILKSEPSVRYGILDRMRSDCDYFINRSRSLKDLWAHNIQDQADYMMEIYNSLEVKPEWITPEQIAAYPQRMYNAVLLENIATDVLKCIRAYYPRPYFYRDRPYVFEDHFIVQDIMEDITERPEVVTGMLKDMMKPLDPAAPFYQDCERAIKDIENAETNDRLFI
jgi:hypothetical protein